MDYLSEPLQHALNVFGQVFRDCGRGQGPDQVKKKFELLENGSDRFSGERLCVQMRKAGDEENQNGAVKIPGYRYFLFGVRF